MTDNRSFKVAILWHERHKSGVSTKLTEGRFSPLYRALQHHRMSVYPVIYSDERIDSVRSQLLGMDAVLVWVNPMEKGQNRNKLNQLLRELSSTGIYVSANPDVIDKMGSKRVLVTTRGMSWGSDAYLYNTKEQLHAEFPARLLSSGPRVLKKHGDSSGSGVWKVEFVSNAEQLAKVAKEATLDTLVRVRQASRGSENEITSLAEFLAIIESYMDETGYVVDQGYQDRIREGTIRCYMVRGVVGGFGEQKVNALLPTSDCENNSSIPVSGPRIYHPPDAPEFQIIKKRMESEWLSELLKTLNLHVHQLPVLWDADFMLGPGSELEQDAYVLCEINTSSVHPFPDSALELVAADVFRTLAKNTENC